MPLLTEYCPKFGNPRKLFRTSSPKKHLFRILVMVCLLFLTFSSISIMLAINVHQTLDKAKVINPPKMSLLSIDEAEEIEFQNTAHSSKTNTESPTIDSLTSVPQQPSKEGQILKASNQLQQSNLVGARKDALLNKETSILSTHVSIEDDDSPPNLHQDTFFRNHTLFVYDWKQRWNAFVHKERDVFNAVKQKIINNAVLHAYLGQDESNRHFHPHSLQMANTPSRSVGSHKYDKTFVKSRHVHSFNSSDFKLGQKANSDSLEQQDVRNTLKLSLRKLVGKEKAKVLNKKYARADDNNNSVADAEILADLPSKELKASGEKISRALAVLSEQDFIDAQLMSH